MLITAKIIELSVVVMSPSTPRCAKGGNRQVAQEAGWNPIEMPFSQSIAAKYVLKVAVAAYCFKGNQEDRELHRTLTDRSENMNILMSILEMQLTTLIKRKCPLEQLCLLLYMLLDFIMGWQAKQPSQERQKTTLYCYACLYEAGSICMSI